MAANTFGHYFQIHSFGESHGPALGCVIEGCPAGLAFDFSLLQSELQRRRPGQQGLQSAGVSQRQESDEAEVLSGVFEGMTLGTPIAIIVRNQDAKSQDYQQIRSQARAGHADDVWESKFGHRDHRGGGRSSGRETIARVMGGAVAKMLLRKLAPELCIFGFSTQIGPLTLTSEEKIDFLSGSNFSKSPQDSFFARFPSSRDQDVRELLQKAQETGESYGARVEIRVKGMVPNLGQPVFHKLKSDLAKALMSVGAVSAFQIGEGAPELEKGTDFHQNESSVYGGIRGGISTGEELILQASLKPTSSILDIAKKGRHDPCIATRAIPVLESMVALVLADHLLLKRLDQI
ncbi:MAG: chorismate synthase [Pseudobdellovibrionaceae bacterium]